jgi:hypothetical protein
MIVRELRAQIQAFLPVGTIRGELAAQRKITSPRAATRLHGCSHLRRFVQREELTRDARERIHEPRVDAVADDVEEAVRPAGVADELTVDIAAGLLRMRCTARRPTLAC